MSAPGHPTHPKKGDVIAGKYQVEDVLGAGGMGVVVAARDLMLRRRVAVKFLLSEGTRIPDAVERFLREARAAVAIQSEHVARVIEVGTLENGAPYMVMEHLAGTDFAKLLKQRGPLPIEEAMDFVLQAGEAIAEAHALGIVHRDLKPGNLFLTTRADGTPMVKVLDFGLSKMEAQEGEAPEASLTATGFVMGSPQYMSPEQVRSLKHIDWRTDIWALGVILYEVLTARRPFDGPSLTAVCVSIGADAPRPMRELRAEIPAGLDAAVMGCLEKDRTRRTRSVSELAQALAPFASAGAQASVQRIARLLPEGATVPLPPTVPGGVAATALAAVTTVPVSQSARAVAPSAPTLPAVVEEPRAPTTAQGSAWGTTGPVARRKPIGVIAGVAMAIVVLVGVFVWVRSSATREGAAPSAASVAIVAKTAAAAKPIEAPAVAQTATAARPVEVPVAAPVTPTASASASATVPVTLPVPRPQSAETVAPQSTPLQLPTRPAPPSHPAPTATPSKGKPPAKTAPSPWDNPN